LKRGSATAKIGAPYHTASKNAATFQFAMATPKMDFGKFAARDKSFTARAPSQSATVSTPHANLQKIGEITVVTEKPLVILYHAYKSLALVCLSTKRHARGTRSGNFSDFTDFTDQKASQALTAAPFDQ
jgi:hypothetical protein